MSIDAPLSKRFTGLERRDAIACAARALIVEKGLEGLRTRDIAAAVGINIATLHYHVPTKEALIGLVAESIRDDFRAQYARRSRDGKSALELLRLEFEDFRETMMESPQLLVLMAELAERARRDPAVSRIMAPMGAFWRSQFADIIRFGVEDGSFRPDVDPAAAAQIITGALSDYARTGQRVMAAEVLFAELERAFVRPAVSNEG
jgi:AcrR family transcriptional regulator